MNFKSSFYNYFFENNQELYVYNFLSTAIAELEKDVWEALKSDKLDNISDDIIENLFENGFVVEKGCVEKNKYRYFLDSVRFGRTRKALCVTFIPTYGCNLACPYCYEGNEHNPKKISNEGIEAVLHFIEKQILVGEATIPLERIEIFLYGGEPLTCKEAITEFSRKTSELAKKYNKKLFFEITTNLTLIDDNIIDLIKEYDMRLQVTIDGDKTAHDSRRIFKNGKGTYDIIINNLKRLNRAGLHDNVIIRVNLDENNALLYGDILNEVKQYANYTYFAFLSLYKDTNANYQNGYMSAESICAKTNLFLNKELIKHGLKPQSTFGKQGPCSICSENKYMIDCNLNVYKCELLINRPECRVGYLLEDGTFVKEPNFYNQMSISPFESKKCTDCKFLPLCGGGCQGTEYIEKGKKDGNTNLYRCVISDETIKEYLISYVSEMKNN